MANYYRNCTVNGAGATTALDRANMPGTYVILTDQGGAFRIQYFKCADSVKREMLASALTAITTNRPVSVEVDPPPYDAEERGH